MRTVRLLVSSPGDVEHERRRVDRVAARLNGEFAGLARIETIRRQASFYTTAEDSQREDGGVADCDIVLAIFWSCLGPELPAEFPRMPVGEPYASETAYEVLTALQARAGQERPDVFVLRKTERPRLAIDADAELDRARAQWTQLQSFLDRLFMTSQGGATFKSFATIDEFEGTIEALLREWIEAHVLLGRSVVWPIAIKGSPFRGLAPFEVEHAPVFFGRARDIARAIDRFKFAAERGTPFLLIVGASGAGKSSLVRAGLVPRLTAPGVAAEVDAWRVALMRPGPRPIEALAEALLARGNPAAEHGLAPAQALPELADGDVQTTAELAAVLRRADNTAAHPILRALDRIGADDQPRGGSAPPSRANLLLVVDQLDDLFAADVSSADRVAFAKLLRALVATERVWVVATLRAALYEPYLAVSDLAALKDAGADYHLASPGSAELAEIVRKPAEAAGLLYETSAAGERLDERLLRDAAGVDVLPQLQFTLQCLFAERQIVGPERRLTFAAYDAIGGIEGAIEQAAERALAGLGEIEIDALPRLLRELVVPVHQAAPSTAGSFALATRAATLVEAASDAAACRLADALVEARILLHEREHGAPTIRLAHHRVLERWRRAREIVAGNFDLFRIRDEIEEQRRRWQAGGRRAKMLLPRGLPLAQAEKVTAILGTELDDPVRGFVAASGRRARKRQRLVTSAAAVLAIVAAFAGWQYFEARTAQQAAEQSERMAVAERDRAIQQRQLAADGQKDAEQQRDIAQKGRERAEQQRQIAQDRQADAEQQRGIAQKRQEEAEAHRLLAEIRRKEADAQRNQALVIQSRVLADLSDQKLKSGDDATAALLALEGLPDETSGIVRPLRPEPQVALTRAWRFQGDERIPREARILMGHAGAVRSCALSRDGLRAVTGSSDRTARVWDAQTGVTVVQLRGHSNEISHVAFTADGGKIVTAADDGVRLWDATTGMQLAVIPEARSFVAMGENGRQVAASSAQNRVHLWDSNTEREVARTMGGAILDTRIGPEGARVLVAAAGNSIELHDPVGGNRLRIFRGHTNRISNAAISRDGQRIASIGDDQTARVWSAANAAQLASLSDPRLRRDVRIGLSPDGGLLVIPLDSGFRLYAIDGRRQVAELAIADGEPSTALFSPDAKLIITASRAQGDLPAPMTAKLWEATTGRQLAILQQAAETTCASFSQDGRQLLTGTSDGIARIWKFDRNSDPVPQIAAGMRGYDRDAAPAAAQALVELSKAHVPRCLTRAQREQAYLDIAPPAWCIEMGKWPYHTPAWKEWLVYKRDADPPRPDTPEWLPWSASRSAGQGDPRRPVK